MTTDPLAVLAVANPVAELPAVPAVESLTCLRESPRARAPGRRRGSRRLAVVTVAVVGLLAVAMDLVLSTGSSGPGVNVAAAAYAATSAGNGVIEAEFAIRSFLPGVQRPALRHREWLDGATGRRREQTIGPGEKVQSELALSPGWAEIWSSGPSAAGTVFRFRDQTRAEKSLKPRGLEFYRQLYIGGHVKLAGREAIDGRLLWKLEGAIGFTQRRHGARLQPVFGEVILVDPTTYLPVIERQVDLTHAGHPTILETRLIRYRRIARGPGSEALVLLSAAHRGAHVISRHVFVPLHAARAQAERGLGGHVAARSRAIGPVLPSSVTGIYALAEDPAGGAAWGMRIVKTTSGLGCIQIGRVASGQLGAIGLDGAFANDGRFHPLAPQVMENPADCARPGPVGRLPFNISSQGVPASDDPLGCSPPGDQEAQPNPPICPERDERAIFAGTLGPSARSVTYTTQQGQLRTTALGPDGAYLIVMRANPRLDQGGANVSGPLPPPGEDQPIRRITYRGGRVCELTGAAASVAGSFDLPKRGAIPLSAVAGRADVCTSSERGGQQRALARRA